VFEALQTKGRERFEILGGLSSYRISTRNTGDMFGQGEQVYSCHKEMYNSCYLMRNLCPVKTNTWPVLLLT